MRNAIYDEDDNVIGEAVGDLVRTARDVAGAKQALVWIYVDGQREAVEPFPSVGLGCTMSWITDRHAGTVIYVSASGGKLIVRQDHAERIDSNGMSECQAYEFTRDPNGCERTFFRCKDGSYKCGGIRLTLGVRGEYYDYSF